MRVLIIDDSMAMRRMLTAYAEGLGAETVSANDGREALAALEREAPFEVALVDWDMPNMNGVEFVKAVREDARWAGMKLVMVTAHINQEDIVEALQTGADDYLMKPVSADMIEDKLRLLGLVA